MIHMCNGLNRTMRVLYQLKRKLAKSRADSGTVKKLVGQSAKEMAKLVKEFSDLLPEEMSLEEKEIVITEGISGSTAYNKFGDLDWPGSEKDEVGKIVINLECFIGPHKRSDIIQRCGPNDTVGYIMFVHARKFIESPVVAEEGGSNGKPKVRLVYAGDQIQNLRCCQNL